jgi:UDP-N-acetylglucosamine 2-epimerase (non-hydrolysing)
LVQGDTTTTFAASLAAFYHRIPVGHVEAGLRSYDKLNPYPEELNRKLTTVLADYHFAPTALAKRNLMAEGVPADRIYVTGNTVVDALLMTVKEDFKFQERALHRIDFHRSRVILVTSHRRENWGMPLENICAAVREIVRKHEEVSVVYPVHLNPNVQRTVKAALRDLPRVHLIEPLDYVSFVNLMKRSYLILTDSGGIQEEAPSLGKPVLVLRTVTERPEASHAGLAKVVGTDAQEIVANVSELLDNPHLYDAMSRRARPYGDGKAARRIVARVLKLLGIK